jgi:hypothetical protein
VALAPAAAQAAVEPVQAEAEAILRQAEEEAEAVVVARIIK